MIAYCWSDGVVEIGRVAPEGAVEIARGNVARLRELIVRPTIWALRDGYPVRVVPGMAPGLDPLIRASALSIFLAQIAAANHRDIRINYPTQDLYLQAERRGH